LAIKRGSEPLLEIAIPEVAEKPYCEHGVAKGRQVDLNEL
jgi:hypothetical protein